MYIDVNIFTLLNYRIKYVPRDSRSQFLSHKLYLNSDLYLILSDQEFSMLQNNTYSNQYRVLLTSFLDNNKSRVDSYNENNIYIYSYSDFFLILKQDCVLDTDAVYLFQGLRWEYLKLLFRSAGFNLSGGSHNLRHLLSPIDLKLSQFYFNLLNFLSIEYTHNTNLYAKYLHAEAGLEKDYDKKGIAYYLINDLIRRSFHK